MIYTFTVKLFYDPMMLNSRGRKLRTFVLSL